MQQRKLSRHLTASSISPSVCVSLTGTGWRCLHSDSWEDKHHVFFAKKASFCQNTISALRSLTTTLGTPPNEKMMGLNHWIIETGTDALSGRILLQLFYGSYRQGLLFLDLDGPLEALSEKIVTQLIGMAFLGHDLSTLKIIPTSSAALEALGCLDPVFASNVTTFSTGHLSQPRCQQLYQFEYHSWFESPQGQESLRQLTWLQKRMERSRANTTSTLKNKIRSSSVIFSILTLGRRKRNSGLGEHPIHKLRR